MIHPSRWLVQQLARALDRDEREAVCGDLTELDVTGIGAVREMLELFVRRQAASCISWRPWVVILGVVLPMGLVLGRFSQTWADRTAIYGFLYVNNWTYGYIESPGARRDLAEIVTRVVVSYLALAGWSWTSGFAIGSLSRRTLWITAPLMCFLVLGGSTGNVGARASAFNAAAFATTFYAVVLPWMLPALLVLLPALAGIRRSARQDRASVLATLAGIVVLAAVTSSTAKTLDASLLFGRELIAPNPGPDGVFGTLDDPRPVLLPLVMMWPAAYTLAAASRQCWQNVSVVDRADSSGEQK